MPETADARSEGGSLEDFRNGWSLMKVELELKLRQQDQLVQSLLDQLSLEDGLAIPVPTERIAILPRDQSSERLESLPPPALQLGPRESEEGTRPGSPRVLRAQTDDLHARRLAPRAILVPGHAGSLPAQLKPKASDSKAYSQGSRTESFPSAADHVGERMRMTSTSSKPSLLWDSEAGRSTKSDQLPKRTGRNFRKRSGGPKSEETDEEGGDTKAETFSAVASLIGKSSRYLSPEARRRMTGLARWWVFLQEPERKGLVARIVLNKKVESIIAFVICANVLFTIYTSNFTIANYKNPAETPVQQYINLSFLLFYSLELLGKLIVHRLYFFCNEDMKWNLFDFFLVVTSTWDWFVSFVAQDKGGASLGFMRTLRLMKMTRILRMLRVVRVFRELKTMLFTLVGSLLALFWCLVMLAFILVMFSLVFVQLITAWLQEQRDIPEEATAELIFWFGSVERSMVTLYMAATGGEDWCVFYDLLGLTGNPALGLIFLFYIAFFSFAVVNVLTGMFVEYTHRVCRKDEDLMIIEQRRKERVDSLQLKSLVEAMDDDKTGTISWAEFDKYMYDERVAMLLASIGLDIKDAEAFFEMLMAQADTEEVEKDAFIDGCMRLKGAATSIDMQSLMHETRSIHLKQREFSLHMLRCLEDLSQAINQVAGDGGVTLAPLPDSPRLAALSRRASG